MIASERWPEVKRIASDALELPAISREGFLARGCPDVLRRDVEELVRSCEKISTATTFMDAPATEFAAPIIRDVEQNPIGLVALQADLAGRYTIERQLGRGGMAMVYLAHDERHRRQVALKVVHSSLLYHSGGSATRFQREIEIAAHLTHPHILPLHDSGTAAGVPYYVMPFVPGASLREHISRTGPLALTDALRLLRDVARALAYAHGQGIVHRDIKPANILLNADGDALIADFGVASAVATDVTTDVTFGTPAYSAPEQLRGESVDQRADLYSFGVVAYEILCGARPHRDDSKLPESLLQQRPDVPPALDALIQKLRAERPSDRPRDAGEVLRSLDALVSVSIKRRRQRSFIALAGILPFAFVGIVALESLRAPWSARIAERGTSNAEAWQAYARGHSLVEDSRPGNLQLALAHFEKATQLDPTFARAWAGMGHAYTMQIIFGDERRDDAIARAKAAVAHALDLDSNLAEANVVHAHQLLVFDCRADEAESVFKRTLALDSTNALAHRWYGWLLHLAGRHDEALAQLRVARRLRPEVPSAEALLGRVFVNLDEPDSAMRYLQNALSFSPALGTAFESLAFAWLEKGVSDSAIFAMRRAAELNGRDSAQLAYVYVATGSREEARKIVQRLESDSQRQPPIVGMAMASAALGDSDGAFRRLETSSCLPGAEVVAGLKLLRTDPRFGDLIRRKGLQSHPSRDR